MFASSSVCDCYCFWWLVVNIMLKKSVLRFTVKELNALIQDEKARVVLQRSIRKLPLQPYCLSDLQGSIHEVLDAKLAKFDNELKGILLSYKNIKIVKDIANVLYDDSRLYLTIQADFYLFMPEVGCVLRGIVNKRSADHIGCLVHKAFNVSIPRPECETDGDWQGYYVEIGQEVTFRVESLDLTGSLPYMLGYLLDVGSLSSPTSKIFAEEKTTKKEEIVAAINKFNGFLVKHEETFADVPTSEHKKKKKHKKYVDLESKANVQDSMFVKHEKYDSIIEKDDQEHGEDGSVLKTPKKKKRKSTDHIAAIKEEEQTYRIGNQREEEQSQYEEQILHNGKQINSSYHLAAFDHLNSTVNMKKKKRKHSEAFNNNDDDDVDDENYNFSTQNESEKSKRKKSKKEKHVIGMPNADEVVEEDFSVDTSQELASQDKKKKKKTKRDVKEETSKDFREETEFHTTDDFDFHIGKDKSLTTSPYINNTPEKLTTEMQFSKEHLKKLSKKVKPLESTELVTLTSVEKKTKKENSFSDNLSHFSVVTGADSHSNFKHTTLLESMDNFSLMHSPILKDKHSKKERESSPSVQSDSVPGKVKKFKKEKRLSSSQPNPVKSISEGYQCSGSSHILQHPESKLTWSDTENLMRGEATHQRSNVTSLTNVQETEHHLIKNSLESPVESKVKTSKKENDLSIKKKDSIGNNVKRTMKTYSNTNNSGDNDASDDHGNDSYNQVVSQCEVSGKAQVSDRLVEQKSDIKRQSSRKSSTPPVNATSKLTLGRNASEDDSSEEENVLKSIPKVSRTPSSERSSKCSRVNALNLSSSQASRSSDRACSSDSGLSLSATSAEKDSNNLTSKNNKRDADSVYSAESLKDGRPVKEKGKLLPKTPKKKKIADAEEDSNHLTTKHRIKKEKESPISQPSKRKTDSTSPLRDNGSLEAERMKLLADMIKRMEEGNEDDLPMKHESHNPLRSSPVKAKQQSKWEGTLSDSDLDTSKSKKMHKRKESNKFKSDLEEVDNMQQLDPISYFKPSAERLSSVSTVPAGKKELDGNRNCLGEGSPVPVQAKISGKTPRRKSTTAAEGSSSKPVTKTPVKTKQKESPKKRKVASSTKSDEEGNSINEEFAGAIAERLLEDFLKRRSL